MSHLVIGALECPQDGHTYGYFPGTPTGVMHPMVTKMANKQILDGRTLLQ